MKLSNVLITATGQGKLVDFGLATISEENDRLLTAAPNARSIDYVALERGTNVRKNDHRSDIYFAGAIFYHMLTGVAPLPDTRDRLMRMNIGRFQQIKPIATWDFDIPMGIQAIVNRSMCLSPKDRYQEPEEMLLDLKRAKHILEKGASEAEAAAPEAADIADTADKADAIEGDVLEGLGKTVLFIESNVKLQNIVREQLKKLGYRVLIISDPDRAIARMEDDIRLADCAIFSAQDLGADSVVAFNKLGELEAIRETPAILLVDRRQTSLIKAAQASDHRSLMAMPLKMPLLRRKVAELISARTQT
jgi:eukaryotic-like serine/threonine-protein kinase